MATLVIPNVFVNGTVADADLVNQNFNAVVGSVNNIDSSNVGPAGFTARDIRPTSRHQAVFGGDYGYTFQQRTASEIELLIQAATNPTGDLFEVVDAGGTVKVWIDSDFAVHCGTSHLGDAHADALHCVTLDMTEQGVVNFGNDGQLTPHPTSLGLRLLAGCAYDWASGQLVAKATATHATSFLVNTGSRPFALYYGAVTAGQPIPSLTEIAFFDTLGNLYLTQTPASITLSGAAQNVGVTFGTVPTGAAYFGWGFYWSNTQNAWVATSSVAFGWMMGVSVPGFTGSTCLCIYNSGLTPGQIFTPSFAMGIGTGANNSGAVVAPNGVQLRNSGLVGGNGALLWSGNSAPVAALGSNGDYFFRTDTPGTANQRIYVKNNSGVWVGIV
jgi:hypothetical protein